jgi:hypothetical protein
VFPLLPFSASIDQRSWQLITLNGKSYASRIGNFSHRCRRNKTAIQVFPECGGGSASGQPAHTGQDPAAIAGVAGPGLFGASGAESVANSLINNKGTKKQRNKEDYPQISQRDAD